MAAADFSYGAPEFVDYTPSGSAVTGGAVVVVGNTPMVAHSDIADGVKGALSIGGGVYRMTAAEAISAGTKVWWVASSSKVDDSAATGDKHFGIALTAASADGDIIDVYHRPDGTASA